MKTKQRKGVTSLDRGNEVLLSLLRLSVNRRKSSADITSNRKTVLITYSRKLPVGQGWRGLYRKNTPEEGGANSPDADDKHRGGGAAHDSEPKLCEGTAALESCGDCSCPGCSIMALGL